MRSGVVVDLAWKIDPRILFFVMILITEMDGYNLQNIYSIMSFDDSESCVHYWG